MKIGVCQIKVIEGQIEKNILHIENTIKLHVDENLDLICFPELCISGYDFNVVKEKYDEKSLFAMMANKYNIKILAGVSSFESDKFYDEVCIWDENGNLIFEYRKIHLWGEERRFFESGEDINIIDINGLKIGVLICSDLGFSEVAKIMAVKGCEIVIVPSAWHSPYEDLFKLMARARAAENQMYVITVNRAAGDMDFCGNSCCCDPSGDIIEESDAVSEDFFEVRVDISKVSEKRNEIPWLKMRLPDIYKKNI